MIEVDQAGAGDPDGADRLRRKPPARQHRGMFDGRNQQPLHWFVPQPRRSPGVSASALASRAARGKHHVLWRPAPDRRRNRGPRVLDQPARLPALRHGRRTGCRRCPRPPPSPAAPRGEAAWSRSSRDRPGQTYLYNITYIGLQMAQCTRCTGTISLIAIGDRCVSCKLPANALNRFQMFKVLAFCPSPHARTPPPVHGSAVRASPNDA